MASYKIICIFYLHLMGVFGTMLAMYFVFLLLAMSSFIWFRVLAGVSPSIQQYIEQILAISL